MLIGFNTTKGTGVELIIRDPIVLNKRNNPIRLNNPQLAYFNPLLRWGRRFCRKMVYL